jgi:hypothetical protein
MSNQVYANMMEVSCKQGSGKSICAFPDVCMTPPQTPATPPGVPIPYPNTGMDGDASDGSSSVKISQQEIMLKNKSYFKTSTGDEAGCAPKKGVVTSTNKGKVYFNAWSMDVKVEGENVVRHLDVTTHNHNPPPGQTPPWPFLAKQTVTKETGACSKEIKNEKKACAGCTPHGEGNPCRSAKCQAARKCSLSPYDGSGSPNCCPPQVAHHILPNSLLQESRGDSLTNVSGLKKTGAKAYTLENGPCVCCSGKKGTSTPIGTHKKMHDLTKEKLQGVLKAGEKLNYDQARGAAAEAHQETFRGEDGKPQCSKECIEAQIDAHMEKTGTGGEVKVLQKDGATSASYEKYKIGKAK